MRQDILPEPLTTAEDDVRDLDGFMLNVERLLASELLAIATAEEFRAAMMLWCRAWKQTPAGSIPNDDRVLASFSGAGRRWKKVRAVALHGFIACSDGRLYHRVLCEDVRRAAAKKRAFRQKTEAASLARWNANSKKTAVDKPQNVIHRLPFDERQHNDFNSMALRDGDCTESVTESQGQGQGRSKDESLPTLPENQKTPISPATHVHTRRRAREDAPNSDSSLHALPGLSLGKSAESAEIQKIPKKPKTYAFDGQIVRLTQADLDRWRQSFPAIPDLVAELTAIDAKFVDQGIDPKRWFGTAAAWLRREHERRTAQAQAPAMAEDSVAGDALTERVAWRSALKRWAAGGSWPGRLGPSPDDAGFDFPRALAPDARAELAALLASARSPPLVEAIGARS